MQTCAKLPVYTFDHRLPVPGSSGRMGNAAEVMDEKGPTLRDMKFKEQFTMIFQVRFQGPRPRFFIGCKYFTDWTKNSAPFLFTGSGKQANNCSGDNHKTNFDSSLEFQGIARHVPSGTVISNSKMRRGPPSNHLHYYNHLINSESGHLC